MHTVYLQVISALIYFVLSNVIVGKISLNLELNVSSAATSQQCFLFWYQNGRKRVHCKTCVKYPEIVKRFGTSSSFRVPPIAQTTGTRKRKDTIENHLASQYHRECEKAERLKSLSAPQNSPSTSTATLDGIISKANEQQANLIGKMALSIYNDAKRLTLAAWNWPSRFVSFELGHLFNYNNPAENTENVKKINLHYVNPKSHANILECIADSSSDIIAKKIQNCLACSLRVDGSIDRTNIDKIYILAKIVNENGALETLFLGVGQQTERGAEGLLSAIKQRIDSHGANFYNICLQKTSSLVTDGANVNRFGLWPLIDHDAKNANSVVPVFKIWCAAHRSELAWGDVNEVGKLFRNLTQISSFLHMSAMRMAELTKVSEERNLKLLHLPKLFEVRWSEFTYSLLNSVLRSWHCLVVYFESSDEAESKGHLRFLTNHKNFQLMVFVADLLFVFQRFQKSIQSDNLHIISLEHNISNLESTISNLGSEQLISGWESTLKESVSIQTNERNEVQVKLKGIELSIHELERRGAHNKKRDFETVRADIINSFTKFLTKRFAVDKELLELAIPFVNLDKNSVQLKKFHQKFGPDLDICSLQLQFNELCQLKEFRDLNLAKKVLHLAENDETSSYKEMLIALSRIMAATPHSADCERVISANNLLKTAMRSNLNLETENQYLHVHFNLPPIENWQPRSTVKNWLLKKQRRHHDLLFEDDHHKAKEQPHFKGVFMQAQAMHLEDGEPAEDSGTGSDLQERSIPIRKF